MTRWPGIRVGQVNGPLGLARGYPNRWCSVTGTATATAMTPTTAAVTTAVRLCRGILRVAWAMRSSGRGGSGTAGYRPSDGCGSEESVIAR